VLRHNPDVLAETCSQSWREHLNLCWLVEHICQLSVHCVAPQREANKQMLHYATLLGVKSRKEGTSLQHITKLSVCHSKEAKLQKHSVRQRNNLTFMGPCGIAIVFRYISNKMQRYTFYFIWNLLYMFRLVPSPIIRGANNCIYSIWYLSHRYCYLPLSWESWNRFECAVGGVGK
jgi:hypothetical protein